MKCFAGIRCFVAPYSTSRTMGRLMVGPTTSVDEFAKFRDRHLQMQKSEGERRCLSGPPTDSIDRGKIDRKKLTGIFRPPFMKTRFPTAPNRVPRRYLQSRITHVTPGGNMDFQYGFSLPFRVSANSVSCVRKFVYRDSRTRFDVTPRNRGLPPPNFTDELVFADPDCTCHEACIETIPKRYGKYNQEPIVRYSDSIRTAMLPPGVTCTELKIHRSS